MKSAILSVPSLGLGEFVKHHSDVMWKQLMGFRLSSATVRYVPNHSLTLVMVWRMDMREKRQRTGKRVGRWA